VKDYALAFIDRQMDFNPVLLSVPVPAYVGALARNIAVCVGFCELDFDKFSHFERWLLGCAEKVKRI